MSSKARRTMNPLAAAWKQTFHLATGNSGCYTRGHHLHSKGAVAQVNATPGAFHAHVANKNSPVHRARITVPEFTAAQWQQLARHLADDPATTADLVVGKVPAAIADPGHAGGPSIIPAAHELGFFCTCQPGQHSRLCDHTAALGHAIADRLNSSATTLLYARGKTARDLADLLRDHLTDHRPAALIADPTGAVRADHAYALHDATGPVAREVHVELDHTQPVTPGLDDPPPPAPAVHDLAWLIEDAATRAQALLDGRAPAPHDELADTIRLLAAPVRADRIPDTAARTQHSEPDLRRLLIAYHHGGPAGVTATAYPEYAPPGSLTQARAAIQRAAPLATLDTIDGQITDTTNGVQLRLGPDRHWYPFTEWNGHWRPISGHSTDPAQTYVAARRTTGARPTRR